MYSARLIHSFKSERERQNSGQIQWVGFISFSAADSRKYARAEKSQNKTRLPARKLRMGVKYFAGACCAIVVCVWAERRARVGEPAAVAMVSSGRQAAEILWKLGGVGLFVRGGGRGPFKMPFSLARQPAVHPSLRGPQPTQ